VNDEALQPDSNPPNDHSGATGADAPPDEPSPPEISEGRHGPEEELTATTHQHLVNVADAYRRVAVTPFLEIIRRQGEAAGSVRAVGVAGKLYGDAVRAFAPAAKLAPLMGGRNAVLAAGLGREWNAVLGGGRWAEMSKVFATAKSAAVPPWVGLSQRRDEQVRTTLAAVGLSGKLSADLVRAFAPAANLPVGPAFAVPRQHALAGTVDDQFVELARLDAERKAAAYRADAAILELLNLTERQAEILDKMSAAIRELISLARMAHAEQQTEATFNRRIQIAILLVTLAALLFSTLGYVFPRVQTPIPPEPVAPSTTVAVPDVHGATPTFPPPSRTSPR
jgi:hypothetical protein